MCAETTERRDTFKGVVINRTEAEVKEAMKVILPADRVGIDGIIHDVIKENINGNYYPFNTGRFYTVANKDINELNRVVNAYIVFGYAPYGVVQYLNNMWVQTITLKEDVRIAITPQSAWSYEQEQDEEIRISFTYEHADMYEWILRSAHRLENQEMYALVCDILDKINNTKWTTSDVLDASYTITMFHFNLLFKYLYDEVKHCGAERDIVNFRTNIPTTAENLRIWVAHVSKKNKYSEEELTLNEFVSFINEIIHPEEK